jgi:hypothetical protein
MRGCSDTEILAWIASVGGTDAFLDQAFCSLTEAWSAQRPDSDGAVIEWDIHTPDRGVVGYHIELERGAWRVERGGSFRPGVVFAVDMANFVRLLIGALDGDEAVNAGTVQVTGDVALAHMIRAWFEANPQQRQ